MSGTHEGPEHAVKVLGCYFSGLLGDLEHILDGQIGTHVSEARWSRCSSVLRLLGMCWWLKAPESRTRAWASRLALPGEEAGGAGRRLRRVAVGVALVAPWGDPAEALRAWSAVTLFCLPWGVLGAELAWCQSREAAVVRLTVRGDGSANIFGSNWRKVACFAPGRRESGP
jgi:hypothetical protein